VKTRPKPANSGRRPGFMPGRRSDSSELICAVSVSKARFFSTLFVVILGFDMAFNRISYSTRGHDCHESHPLLLILA
jgi:hypothetical protein